MKFRFPWYVLPALLAMLGTRQAAGQDPLQTRSGPFWEHRVTISSLDTGCGVTVNGTELTDSNRMLRVPGPEPNANINFKLICHTSWGYANLAGTLGLSKFLPQIPILNGDRFVGHGNPPMPTHALLFGPLQVTATSGEGNFRKKLSGIGMKEYLSGDHGDRRSVPFCWGDKTLVGFLIEYELCQALRVRSQLGSMSQRRRSKCPCVRESNT